MRPQLATSFDKGALPTPASVAGCKTRLCFTAAKFDHDGAAGPHDSSLGAMRQC
jgi:hypothetical protein